jgi:hypothetical protein
MYVRAEGDETEASFNTNIRILSSERPFFPFLELVLANDVEALPYPILLLDAASLE